MSGLVPVLAFLPNIGPVEMMVVGVSLVSLGLPVWAIIDAMGYPDTLWAAVGRGKTVWVVFIAIGTFLCLPIGVIAAVGYLAMIRPRLDEVGRSTLS